MKINVLGAEYTFQVVDEITDDQKLSSGLSDDCSGFCDPFLKMIIVEKQTNDCETKRIAKHEILHAFFIESGMIKWYDDEDLIQWISFQYLKMNKVLKEVDML